MESVKLFFWDPRTKKCLGRTGDSWLKIIAFYIALYAILAAVWSLFFLMFQQTISERYPKWQLDESLIGTNPGLGFRPQNPPSRIDSALISYRSGNNGDYQHWINDLNNYFDSKFHLTRVEPNLPSSKCTRLTPISRHVIRSKPKEECLEQGRL